MPSLEPIQQAQLCSYSVGPILICVMVAHLRHLFSGSRIPYMRTLNGMTTIQMDIGGDEPQRIKSLKNEQGQGQMVAI